MKALKMVVVELMVHSEVFLALWILQSAGASSETVE
jgi:hypothetical protein